MTDPDALARRLREGRVRDPRVLEAIASVPRERFVPADWAGEAYADRALPIGGGQTISQPTVVGRMCELLELQPTDRVLDVGTGSGYHAAVMARLCAHVWGIELDPELARRAAHALEAVGVHNVTVLAGDGREGLVAEAPFDAINVAATARRRPPPALEAQLAPGGRLIVPITRWGDERLVRVRRIDAASVTREALDRVRFVPLR